MCALNSVAWVSLGIAAVCTACAHNTAPTGWLPKPAAAQTAAYGGWIELTHHDTEERRTDGELIAVSAESLWVLSGNQGLVIPTAEVKSGKLTAYAAQHGPLTLWTIVGTLSTISNGAFLIFTAPMWIIGGSLAVAGESRAPQRNSPSLAWVELAPFARFPQGLPPGVELTALLPKQDYGPAKQQSR
jgi:hypothetical protein